MCGGYPALLLRGIVYVPVTRTLATLLPETVPANRELIAAILAIPLTLGPNSASRNSVI